jgi:crotonobetainyl-CoA:carnitine CoA-transferase CaiB-like acyl-CoA transferase
MPDGSSEAVTREEATPEERAAVRERFRRKLAESSARHTPEYFAELRARFGFPANSFASFAMKALSSVCR